MRSKLQLKPGNRVLVLQPPGSPSDLLGPLPDGATTVSDPPADAVVLFVRDRDELERRIGEAAMAAEGDRVLWVAYPKGGSGVKIDLNRDLIRLWVEEKTDLRTVTQVALDPTWSALRLRPAGRVGA